MRVRQVRQGATRPVSPRHEGATLGATPIQVGALSHPPTRCTPPTGCDTPGDARLRPSADAAGPTRAGAASGGGSPLGSRAPGRSPRAARKTLRMGLRRGTAEGDQSLSRAEPALTLTEAGSLPPAPRSSADASPPCPNRALPRETGPLSRADAVTACVQNMRPEQGKPGTPAILPPGASIAGLSPPRTRRTRTQRPAPALTSADVVTSSAPRNRSEQGKPADVRPGGVSWGSSLPPCYPSRRDCRRRFHLAFA